MNRLPIAASGNSPSPKKPKRSNKLFDGDGLYIEIYESGGKLWRLKYHFGGVEKRLTLGRHPEVKVEDARKGAREARKQIASGIDPLQNRKAQKEARKGRAANSFEVVGREWLKS